MELLLSLSGVKAYKTVDFPCRTFGSVQLVSEKKHLYIPNSSMLPTDLLLPDLETKSDQRQSN